MKKSLTILVSLACLQVLSANPAASYEYRSNLKPVVETDTGLLDHVREDLGCSSNMPSSFNNMMSSFQITPPNQTPVVDPQYTEVIEAPLEAPAQAAPKRLSKPFFTATPAADIPHAEDTASISEIPLDLTTPPPSASERNNVQMAEARINEPSMDEPRSIVPTRSDLTLDFEPTSSALSPQNELKLDTLSEQMQGAPDMRIQIRAYAQGNGEGSSNARRMALSRGLMVRSYLTDKGIKPTRLDVRALGSETDSTPVDRVDLVFVR